MSTIDPERLSSDDYTDLWNAEQLILAHGADLKYCSAWGWVVWTGTHWAIDDLQHVMRWAKQTVRSYYGRASLIENDKARDSLVAHAKRSSATHALKSMIESAQSEIAVVTTTDVFDQDPWLFNCANGTIDLRTGVLRPHERADLITKFSPVTFDPAALCPTWDTMLAGVFAGATDTVQYVQRSAGYSLTGNTREKVFFLLHGPGANNGKSTLLGTLRHILGTYGSAAKADSFLIKRNDQAINNDIAGLAGSRFVTASETERERQLAVALVKELSGVSDPIKARFLRKEYFEFVPTFKIWLATNHLPKIEGDNGIWNRIRLIPFMVSFSTPDNPLDGAPPADLRMAEKLQQELPGILAWAVRGCLEWQQMGLAAPEAVKKATSNYRLQEDVMARFLEDCCLIGRGKMYSVTHTILYETWNTWRLTHEGPTLSSIAFAKAMRDNGFISRRAKDNVLTWDGLGLRISVAKSEPNTEITELPKITDFPVTLHEGFCESVLPENTVIFDNPVIIRAQAVGSTLTETAQSTDLGPCPQCGDLGPAWATDTPGSPWMCAACAFLWHLESA